MPSRLSLRNFDVFRERAAELADIGRPISEQLGRHMPGAASSIWNERESLARARDPLDRAALAGARVRASARSVTIRGATSPRVMRGHWQAVEFGDGRSTYTTYTRRYPSGTTGTVRRRTQEQLPARRTKGRVLYPAADRALKRFASLAASTIIRTIGEALEGRGRG